MQHLENANISAQKCSKFNVNKILKLLIQKFFFPDYQVFSKTNCSFPFGLLDFLSLGLPVSPLFLAQLNGELIG